MGDEMLCDVILFECLMEYSPLCDVIVPLLNVVNKIMISHFLRIPGFFFSIWSAVLQSDVTDQLLMCFIKHCSNHPVVQLLLYGGIIGRNNRIIKMLSYSIYPSLPDHKNKNGLWFFLNKSIFEK